MEMIQILTVMQAWTDTVWNWLPAILQMMMMTSILDRDGKTKFLRAKLLVSVCHLYIVGECVSYIMHMVSGSVNFKRLRLCPTIVMLLVI